MDVRLIYSEERGTWNVFNGAEWYYEGNYKDANEIYTNLVCPIEDDYEEEEDYDYD